MAKTTIAPLIDGRSMTACAYSGALRNRKTGCVVSVSSLILTSGRPLAEKDYHAIGDARVLEKMHDPEINKAADGDDWEVISHHVEFTTIGIAERE